MLMFDIKQGTPAPAGSQPWLAVCSIRDGHGWAAGYGNGYKFRPHHHWTHLITNYLADAKGSLNKTPRQAPASFCIRVTPGVLSPMAWNQEVGG